MRPAHEPVTNQTDVQFLFHGNYFLLIFRAGFFAGFFFAFFATTFFFAGRFTLAFLALVALAFLKSEPPARLEIFNAPPRAAGCFFVSIQPCASRTAIIE